MLDFCQNPCDCIKVIKPSDSMRKIEAQMNSAIANRMNWKSTNTEVSFLPCGDTSIVTLYGNKIAEIGEGFIRLFDGGSRSKTTKSRISAILEENGFNDSIFQRNHCWFVTTNDTTIPFTNGMILS